MATTTLTSGKLTADQSLYATDEFTPSATSLVLAFVANARQGFGQTATLPSITGNGLLWQRVDTLVGGERADLRLTCFRAVGVAPSAGVAEIQFGDTTQDFCFWTIVEISGADTANGGANAVVQRASNTGNVDSLTVTLAPSDDPAHNTTVAAVAVDVGLGESRPITAGAGFTEVDQLGVDDNPFRRTVMQTQSSTTNPGSASWSWPGADFALAIAVEIKAAVDPATGPGSGLPSDPTEALVKRFEPVLFLHEDETFFPSDAKQYVEKAALWGSTAPFGDKTGWSQRVPTGQLAATQSEATPGRTFLGAAGNTTASGTDVRFLEVGGWKDKDGNHEATASSTTTNLYADRADVERLYPSNDLSAWRFWYHAEVYPSARLTTLASKVVAPNLSRILATYAHPTLLCYYFFFPAHDQGVDGGTCTNVEAREAYGHAGDWQCVAILLEGDGTDNPLAFSPQYFGYTGTRPQAADGVTPPIFSGDDDLGGYTVMKVVPWRSGSATTRVEPDLDGEHPRFYVAKGSHTLYTDNGTYAVAPEVNPSLSPSACGTRDDNSPIPGDPSPHYKSALENLAALLAKMVSTGFFGAAWVGLVSGIIESISDSLQPFGSDPVTLSPDPVTPEVTPPAGEAITIKPKNVTAAGSGVQVFDWPVAQGFSEGGLTYDYVVDRGSQIYWPSDDLKSNFRGRWGQHVTEDVLDRRNGPHFLQYWKMFLTAMAGQ